jgi:hypothetical protein
MRFVESSPGGVDEEDGVLLGLVDLGVVVVGHDGPGIDLMKPFRPKFTE